MTTAQAACIVVLSFFAIPWVIGAAVWIVSAVRGENSL